MVADRSLSSGPLPDAIRLVTHNASQPAHIPRPPPPQSIALLKRLVDVGRVANKLVEIYPSQKWDDVASCCRRLLTSDEAHRLRRATYRHWLFSKAFHQPSYPRESRGQPALMRARAALLRPWPAPELAEIMDVQETLRDILAFHVFPSNASVLRRHSECWPDSTHPFMLISRNMHHRNYGSTLRTKTKANYQNDPYPYVAGCPSAYHGKQTNILQEGWGDDITHYYVIEDMLKLNPQHILWLYQHVANERGWQESDAPILWIDRMVDGNHWPKTNPKLVKAMVEDISAPWFGNNGQTLGETLEFVAEERGEDGAEMKLAVVEGQIGVVRGAYW